MAGKPRREGYLLIDHTFSPGITPEQMHAAGLNPAMAVGADKKGEFATLTCGHCCDIVIVNPGRTRERAYCDRCPGYICDACGAAMAITGKCVSIDRLLDFVQDENAKTEDRGLIVSGLPDLSPLLTTVSIPTKGE